MLTTMTVLQTLTVALALASAAATNVQSGSERPPLLSREKWSVWVRADDDIKIKEFDNTIKLTAEKYSKFGLKPFMSHVTVQGGITEDLTEQKAADRIVASLEKWRKRFEGQPPARLTVKLGETLKSKSHFFDACTVPVESVGEAGAASTGFEQLAWLRDELGQQFGIENSPEYTPHMSVAYGWLNEDQQTTLRNDPTLKNMFEGESFVVSHVHLIKSGPDMSKWDIVRSFPLF